MLEKAFNLSSASLNARVESMVDIGGVGISVVFRSVRATATLRVCSCEMESMHLVILTRESRNQFSFTQTVLISRLLFSCFRVKVSRH
jgi:hypothetical protein